MDPTRNVAVQLMRWDEKWSHLLCTRSINLWSFLRSTVYSMTQAIVSAAIYYIISQSRLISGSSGTRGRRSACRDQSGLIRVGSRLLTLFPTVMGNVRRLAIYELSDWRYINPSRSDFEWREWSISRRRDDVDYGLTTELRQFSSRQAVSLLGQRLSTLNSWIKRQIDR